MLKRDTNRRKPASGPLPAPGTVTVAPTHHPPTPPPDSTRETPGSGSGPGGGGFGSVVVWDVLPLPVWIVDASLCVRDRNAEAQRRWPDVHDLRPLLSSFEPTPSVTDWADAFRLLLHNGQSARWRDVAADGSVCPGIWDVTCTAIAGADGGPPPALVVALQDATERASLHEQVASYQHLAAIGKLVAKVAHELNNPLDGILRYINLAIRVLDKTAAGGGLEDANRSKLSDYLDRSKTGLVRMAQIIRELLEFSRGGQGRYDLTEVNQVIEEAIRAVGAQADASNVVIAADFQTRNMPAVPGGRLLQVATNIMKNAIDAMPEGGRLVITTARAGGEMILRIADTGPGLGPDPTRVFEPFYTTKPEGKGTGLGLAICKDLVEGMGGTINAANGDDGGALFTIRIPIPTDEQRDAPDT